MNDLNEILQNKKT